MKQKPLSGDPFIGKKHIILLTMFNLMPLLLYVGFWIMAIYTDMVSDLLLASAYFSVMYGLFVLAPIMLTFLAFSLVCLFDFAVLFFDKHIYAYTHSRKKEEIESETQIPKPLI